MIDVYVSEPGGERLQLDIGLLPDDHLVRLLFVTLERGVCIYHAHIWGAFLYAPSLVNANFSGCTSRATIGWGAFNYATSLVNADFSGCTSLATIGD